MRKISRQKAAERKDKYYFTGVPCSRGGVGPRLVSNGSCKCDLCKEYKNNFSKTQRKQTTREDIKQHILENSEYFQEFLKQRIVKTNGCWEWQYQLNFRGYGVTSIFSKTISTHIVSFIAFNEQNTNPGLCLDHLCDNRKCCNPKHLREVTYKQNTSYMIRKGRAGWQKK